MPGSLLLLTFLSLRETRHRYVYESYQAYLSAYSEVTSGCHEMEVLEHYLLPLEFETTWY